MSEARTVYAISSGCYSDYSVQCVFETLEDAKEYLRKQYGTVTFDERSQEWIGHPPERPADADYWGSRIEEFQFWPAGVVPHADA